MNPCEFIWVNGEYVAWESASTHILTHTLHYGSGVFEGIRAYTTDNGPAIFKANEHYERLLESCRAYDISCNYTEEELIKATQSLILKNKLPSCYIRPIVFTNYGSIGIIPSKPVFTTAIAVWEWGSYLGDQGLSTGIRCVISDIIKTPSSSMPSSAKSCANYANSFLAKKKAINEGYDEAILLNQAGFISEGPGENIFIIKHGQLFTPTLADDILKGITRDTVITIANDMGIETIEKQLTIEDLLTSDECFFTGTAAEVTPIREINNQTIGNGGKGHLTSTIQSAYFNIVKGKDNNYASWLTMCND
jgi:branched-chain amino acid aminotransferase